MRQLREDLERKYKKDDVLLFVSYACAFPNIMIRIYSLLTLNHDQPFGKSLMFLLLEAWWIILIPCLPPVFVGWTTAEVNKIKLLLLNSIICNTDTQEKHDAQLFVRYLRLRPFRERVWRVFSADAASPLRLISLCTTYLIVMVQLTHLYFIPTQKAGNTLVTPLRLSMSCDCPWATMTTYLLSGGLHSPLLFENTKKKFEYQNVTRRKTQPSNLTVFMKKHSRLATQATRTQLTAR
ncbi:hypothetical protein EVAR_101859_1 [Eumeta japonica]|uniref:Gustatory receptor n=1 Tax=Eumeta variegata TaxID=151549 RepID=A0A4C1SR41_EUMVA|nr:hypothetical protein EVAR_101859_1 [Eumeta japonica]